MKESKVKMARVKKDPCKEHNIGDDDDSDLDCFCLPTLIWACYFALGAQCRSIAKVCTFSSFAACFDLEFWNLIVSGFFF
ncbi:hypothetical protein EV2_039099 [Malus domestica]